MHIINHCSECYTAATVSGFEVRNMITTSDINLKPSQQKQRHIITINCTAEFRCTLHDCGAFTNNSVNIIQLNEMQATWQ